MKDAVIEFYNSIIFFRENNRAFLSEDQIEELDLLALNYMDTHI